MKPLHLFSLVMLLFTGYGYAQRAENTAYNNIWQLQTDSPAYVYIRMANIRSAASTEAAIQDSLPAGAKVTVLSQDTVLLQLKGIYAPWAKVKYNAGNQQRVGYVWMGMLAVGSFEKEGTRFVYGIEKIIPAKNITQEDFVSAKWYMGIKAMAANGTITDEQEMKMDGLETTYCTGKLLGDMGLTNTNDIVRLSFGGEACGIPTYYYYFGWTGNKLLPLPGKMEVGDAGVYYHSETFIFPKEPGGQPDKIFKLTEEGEADEEKVDKNGEPIFKIKKSRQVWLWHGSKAVKSK